MEEGATEGVEFTSEFPAPDTSTVEAGHPTEYAATAERRKEKSSPRPARLQDAMKQGERREGEPARLRRASEERGATGNGRRRVKTSNPNASGDVGGRPFRRRGGRRPCGGGDPPAHGRRDRRRTAGSRLVQKPVEVGEYHGMTVRRMHGLLVANTPRGWRVVLPPALWAVVFKEMHRSVWAGHLRGPHTYGRVAQLYWWPNLQREVQKWARGCQECGSRKARPREVVPPLRSIRGGDVGDRWALDVADPFPVADGGERYVVAALEYVTRYAVARGVTQHTADKVATFLMEDVVLRFGVFRELLTDGAP
ncbi:hypothetical protein PF001_g22419 [Phytophthora fragariae]|uniref:Integrase catalytic domain-containing protein n=1 Tax=Phytophthora fragariae TaxID=53985 RepID=A0A6A4C2R1_9STRA|nr:hypothetical protein PF001_g22419 [Phytophthora fragariae]